MTMLQNQAPAGVPNTLHDQGVPNTLGGMVISVPTELTRVQFRVIVPALLILGGALAILVARLA